MELLQNIFQSLDYELMQSKDDVHLYKKEGEEYYLLSSYKPQETAVFFDHTKTTTAYDLIEEHKSNLPDIAKNTSMIIWVEVDDLSQGLVQLRNSVYAIEEDPYVFRKYVIFSTSSARETLEGKQVKDIVSYVTEPERFQQYQTFDTRYVDEAYCLAIQLIIKLPFLQLPDVSVQLDDLRAQLTAGIGEDGKLVIEGLSDVELEENDDVRTQALIPSSDNEFDQWLDSSLSKLGVSK